MEKAVCKCGRDYYPKQAWIHVPLCCYVDEVPVNHVRPENRGSVNKGVLTVNSPVIKRWGDVNNGVDEVSEVDGQAVSDISGEEVKKTGVAGKTDRKEYMKQKMREYREKKRAEKRAS